MSLFQQQDKSGRWHICGDGIVVARQGNPAVHETLAFGEKKVPKISFILKVGTIAEKNEETGETSYKPHNINCSVYGVKGQELLYAFARTLETGETIAFWGKLWEKQSEEEGVNYREIQLSSILPISHFLRAFLGTDGDDFAKLQVRMARSEPTDSTKKNKRKEKGDLPF